MAAHCHATLKFCIVCFLREANENAFSLSFSLEQDNLQGSLREEENDDNHMDSLFRSSEKS